MYADCTFIWLYLMIVLSIWFLLSFGVCTVLSSCLHKSSAIFLRQGYQCFVSSMCAWSSAHRAFRV
jgi:hypothetical protein